MAVQPILRNGIVSPTRTLLRTTGSARSILKRPGTLPPSPTYPTGYSIQTSPSPLLKSPHVQFRPPSSLVSTFSTYSAGSYDRAPIQVSPLERTYMTSLEGFKLSAPPKPFRSIAAAQCSPAITDFEDPRSPKVQPAAKQVALRFATFNSNQTVTRPCKPLARSLTSYPRSPCPSAPLTPTKMDAKDRDAHDIVRRARSWSLGVHKRNKKGLTLTPFTRTPVAPTPSSSFLGRSIFSPSTSSVNRTHEPVPLDLETRLSQDFWQSLSLVGAEKTDNQVMETALEYPMSAVEYDGKMDMDTHPSQPQFMYASTDGVLWSPGMPEPAAALHRIRNSLMSPSKKLSSRRIVRKDITAPSPNDPFSAFPSFAAAIKMGSPQGYFGVWDFKRGEKHTSV